MPKIFRWAVERRQLLQLLHRLFPHRLQRGAHVLVLSLHHDANVQVAERGFGGGRARSPGLQSQRDRRACLCLKRSPQLRLRDAQTTGKARAERVPCACLSLGNIQRPLYHAPEATSGARRSSAGAPRLELAHPGLGASIPSSQIDRTACATRSAARRRPEALSLRAPRRPPVVLEEPGSRSLLPPLKDTDDPRSRKGSTARRATTDVLAFADSAWGSPPRPVDAGRGTETASRCVRPNASRQRAGRVTRVPRRNATRSRYGGAGGEPLTDREAIRANRALMSGLADFDDEAEPTRPGEELRRDGIGMRAFWLTTHARWSGVEEPSKT
ncbi:hypothetical protein Q5P01_000921 [Channa striata]|uniref:Uncharacterized protein n=1 Tax=Channa striata TaxID=64152 RepID=A0AA88IRA9_CHASR|nr:hypothetical protein Q5P01_000921 [Channa striata]